MRALLLLGLSLSACVSPREAAAPARRPNILFVMIDDLGWMDLRVQGNDRFRTPNIDKLATEGTRFTDFYAAAPVCSPTRAACVTGLAPARLQVTPTAGATTPRPRAATTRGVAASGGRVARATRSTERRRRSRSA